MWVFTVFIFFEVCERAKFSKSCNLIDGLFPSPSPWAGEGSNAHAWFRPEQMQRRLTNGGGEGRMFFYDLDSAVSDTGIS